MPPTNGYPIPSSDRGRRRGRRLPVGALSAGAALAIGAGVLSASPGLAASQPVCGNELHSSVTLTANLDCSTYTGGPALTIGADGVTLNLGGFSIIGPGGASGTYGVAVSSHGLALNKDTVTNGTIQNFQYGVYVYAARNLKLTGLTMLFDVANSYNGVYAQNVAVGTFSQISAQSASIGIQLYGSANVTVSHANLDGSSPYGYYGQFNTRNTISSSHANGGGSSALGFASYNSQESFISDTANNDGDGFYIYGDSSGITKIKSSQANDNASMGFYLYHNYNGSSVGRSPFTSVTGNTATGNGADGFFDDNSIGATYDNNRANNNGQFGININLPGRYTITDNATNYNGSTGIYLFGNSGPANNVKTASHNTAQYNSNYGLYADFATIGKDNTAKHNTPSDCFNFVCKGN